MKGLREQWPPPPSVCLAGLPISTALLRAALIAGSLRVSVLVMRVTAPASLRTRPCCPQGQPLQGWQVAELPVLMQT
jgi:hypothetical protein